MLVWLLAAPRRLWAGAVAVVGADLVSVAGAVVVIGLAPAALPPSGDVALAGVTAVVAALAAGQVRGWQGSGRGRCTARCPSRSPLSG